MNPTKNRSLFKEQLRLDLLKFSLPETNVKLIKTEFETVLKLYNNKNRLIGYAKIEEKIKAKERSLYICYAEVKDKYHGKGYGQCLYREILKYAQKNRLTYLCSDSISKQALRTRSILMNNCEKYKKRPYKIKIPNLIY